MNPTQAPLPHHELSIGGMAPWPVPAMLSMDDVQANPAARCCKECGRRLLLLLLRSSNWVSRRTEHVSFRDDRSVVRRVTVEFHVPEQAPVFRGDDGETYHLLPLSVMRRKTLVNFELRDGAGMPVPLPSLRHNQAITESVLLACADATIGQTGGTTHADADSPPEVAAFVHQVVSGTQQQLARAYDSLAHEVAPAVADLTKNCLFRAILDRLADNFVLWVMIAAGAPRRRVLTFSCDEPLHLRYREPGFQLTTSTLSSWAVFALLLAFATHETVLKKERDLPALILIALASGIAALLAQPDTHGLAAHLLKSARALATIAVALPLVAMSFIMFESVHPSHVPPALWTAAGIGGVIAVILSTVWLASWRRQRRIVVRSPWEQNRARGHEIREQPENFERAEKKYRYKEPAMRVDSAEGWHTDFLWNQEAEEQLIAALESEYSAHHSPDGASSSEPATATAGTRPATRQLT